MYQQVTWVSVFLLKADCLLDLFSLDSTIGTGVVPAYFQNGIIDNRLVSLPYGCVDI